MSSALLGRLHPHPSVMVLVTGRMEPPGLLPLPGPGLLTGRRVPICLLRSLWQGQGGEAGPGWGWQGLRLTSGWAPGLEQAPCPLPVLHAPWEEADGAVSSTYAQSSQNQPSVPRNRGAAPRSSWWGSRLASPGAP